MPNVFFQIYFYEIQLYVRKTLAKPYVELSLFYKSTIHVYKIYISTCYIFANMQFSASEYILATSCLNKNNSVENVCIQKKHIKDKTRKKELDALCNFIKIWEVTGSSYITILWFSLSIYTSISAYDIYNNIALIVMVTLSKNYLRAFIRDYTVYIQVKLLSLPEKGYLYSLTKYAPLRRYYLRIILLAIIYVSHLSKH